MIGRIAPASVPVAAWGDMSAVRRLRLQRDDLRDRLRWAPPTAQRSLVRRRRLEEITRELLEREARLTAAGLDAAVIAELSRPVAPARTEVD